MKAIPIDSVIAVNAEARGVEIVYGDAEEAREQLDSERFDCILFSNVLHLVRDPAEFLSRFAELLAPEGRVIASVPNLSRVRLLARRLRFGKTANPKNYESSGMHVSYGALAAPVVPASGAPSGQNCLRNHGTRKKGPPTP